MDTHASRAEDVLSNVLASYRAEKAVTARFTLSAPWSLHSIGVDGLLLRTCTGSPYWLQVQGADPVLMKPRDIALLSLGSPHTVSSCTSVAPQPIRDLIDANTRGAHGDHPIVFSHGGGGESTRLHSLHLWMPRLGLGAILAGLPSLVVLRHKDHPLTPSLARAMQSLINESILQRPGWQLTAARMADLLLAHALRAHLTDDRQLLSGSVRALDDDAIARSLTLIHQRPGEPWTVAKLAQASHLSRTVFCDRFRELVGMPAMQYLATHRMTIAAQKLRVRQLSIPAVAHSLGYESEKAFSRAFQRWSGLTPSSYSKERCRAPEA